MAYGGLSPGLVWVETRNRAAPKEGGLWRSLSLFKVFAFYGHGRNYAITSTSLAVMLRVADDAVDSHASRGPKRPPEQKAKRVGAHGSGPGFGVGDRLAGLGAGSGVGELTGGAGGSGEGGGALHSARDHCVYIYIYMYIYIYIYIYGCEYIYIYIDR